MFLNVGACGYGGVLVSTRQDEVRRGTRLIRNIYKNWRGRKRKRDGEVEPSRGVGMQKGG